MPRLIMTMLLSIAAFCVNAQTKDSTYKTTHDSLQATIVADTAYNWYDSTYKTPRRDSMYLDTTWTYCKIRGRSLFSFLYFKSAPTYRYCDTAKRPRRRYNDSLMTVNIINTSTQPKDTISSFCCHVEYGSHIEYKLLPTTHDTIVQVIVTIPDNTIKWGLKIQQDKTSNQINVAKQFPLSAIRPNAVSIRDFNGKLGNVVDFHNAGLFTVLNANWIDNPSEKPYNFVSGVDTVKFKTNFEAICKAGQGIINVIVIENEPTNEGYYNWDSAKYIHELQMAIPIAKKYGIKITDGCVHLELVELVRTGKTNTNKNAPKVKSLLAAYKNLNLDWVDVHCSYNNGSYPVTSIKVTADYIRQQTGKDIICNEYSMQGATATQVNKVWTSPQVTWFVTQWKEAKVTIVLPWSGDNSKSNAYNIGTDLTGIGYSYQGAIK